MKTSTDIELVSGLVWRKPRSHAPLTLWLRDKHTASSTYPHPRRTSLHEHPTRSSSVAALRGEVLGSTDWGSFAAADSHGVWEFPNTQNGMYRKDVISAQSSRTIQRAQRPAACHNPLLAARLARKMAEDDHQLLQNRLNRLQVVEERAAAKLEEARRHADVIVGLKARNLKTKADKELFYRQREEETAMAQQRASTQRQARSLGVQTATFGLSRKKREDMLITKKERREHETKIQRDRDLQLAESSHSRAQVKAHEEYVKKNVHLHKIRNTNKSLEKVQSKCQEERELRRQTVSEVREMQRKEADLISRLKLTQESQRTAYDQLEEVHTLEAEEVLRRASELDPVPPTCTASA